MRDVAGQVFLLQVAVVVLLVAAVAVALVVQARNDIQREARHASLAVAETFAHSPGLVEAMESPDPPAVLQPRAEEARKGSGVSYVVVWNTNGLRYTHPDANLIGKRVIGPYKEVLDAARAGRSHTRTFRTSTGPTVNSAVPVTRADGSLVGMVSAGVTVENVNAAVERQLLVLIGAAVGALALATGGAALVSRRLRRQTHDLGPAEMTRMYEHHDAVLHAVREGVLITSGEGRLVLVNDEARRLLDLPPEAEGRQVTDLGLDARMAELLASDRTATDEIHRAAGRLLACNKRATAGYGRVHGSVVTVRDSTELQALVGRVEVAQERLKLLYDAGARIGTTLNVERTAQELTHLAVSRFADFTTVDLLEPVSSGGEAEPPAPGGSLVFRRAAQASVLEGCPESVVPVGSTHAYEADGPVGTALTGGKAVRFDIDEVTLRWWAEGYPERARSLRAHGIHSMILAPLAARGTTLGFAIFCRHRTEEPFDDDDLMLIEELAARSAVSVDNARRYTQERATAVALQRSLLPRVLPEQSAVEVAYRYLPTQAGVGGDWFDVISLPGARVALAVGDVVGHGLHAAATMGRLRTAVYNFSTLDLPPDELLAHLDELVAHVDQDARADGEAAKQGGDESGAVAITGATCLYAIYDPVTGMCTMARAGHPGPALAHPDGTVTFPDVPVSPPLGLGGEPFETVDLHLPEGSRIVLFTDGLIESRERDIDTGLELLRTAVAHSPRNPEETCQTVLEALLPPNPSDDIALLVARTRLLDPDRVAEWDIPQDPAAVAPLRTACTRRLEQWGLAEVGVTTELILSELVTNAIRHGTDPIHLRLLLDRNALICEVADGSSTSPHLRRAKSTDEGGRGLFLVAQFAHRWGTRYTPRGKIIWTEQHLHNGSPDPGDDLTHDMLLDQWDDTAM